jgi:Outer membrane lipoprotein-sorting protein
VTPTVDRKEIPMNQTPNDKTATTRRLLLSLALLGGTLAHAQADVPRMLKDVDRMRGGGDQVQVEMEITLQQADGQIEKTRRYTVFAQDARRSLVVMRSPADQGQKMLMLGDDFWLLMPGSQRPLRITPAQKLLGEASTGDVATLNWAEDYEGRVVGEERCERSSPQDALPCWHLDLKAKRSGVSYQRIELWVGAAHHEPLRADLYVHSEKLAKQARFVVDQPQAPTRVDEMALLDTLGSRKTTRVRYLTRQARAVPETWLNPMYLARQPVLE